ncbi:DUF5427 domain-containing protein MTC1 RNJ42_01045 [Nakaseomyces bracarensis]|uniref:DUF5427 domain-containing protein MTC1 n=1 Tax=Nakaseomyces bracarensis TaxID=273131 RepID=UPI0038710207
MVDRSTEADEVFEFLDSLPEDKDKPQTGKDEEDVFEFLEELEKSKLGEKKGGNDKKSKEKSKKHDAKTVKEEKKDKEVEKNKKVEEKKEPVEEKKEQVEEKNQEDLQDPLATISNWWSTSGSATVSSLWSKTTEQASQIRNKIQQEQLDITSRLNTQTLTDLARNLQKIVVGETDEVLRIHLVHDLVKFPSLQYHIENRFDQVMSSQVEGGIRIFVDEWGRPNRSNSISTVVNLEQMKDGKPIVESSEPRVKLNLFTGKISDGEKLAFANIDNSIKLFNKAHEEYFKQQKTTEGEGEAEKSNTDGKSDSNDRISDIFISILPIAIPAKDDTKSDDMIITDTHQAGNFSFTIVLKDISNNITAITRSQAFPANWVEWLEGNHEKKKEKKSEDDDEEEDVDPGEWVKDWIEDGLSLSVGVLAQTYVIKRMGL